MSDHYILLCLSSVINSSDMSMCTALKVTEKRLRFDDLPIPGPRCEGEGSPIDSNCLIWHGKFPHKYYGAEVPAFRSQGIVNMSAEDLVDLIMDSDRVAEYNKSSTGRRDEVILSDGSDLEGPFSGKRRKKLTGVVTEGTKIIDGTSISPNSAYTWYIHSLWYDLTHIAHDLALRTGTAFVVPGDDDDDDEDDDQSSFEPFTIDISRERKPSQYVGVTKVVRRYVSLSVRNC